LLPVILDYVATSSHLVYGWSDESCELKS